MVKKRLFASLLILIILCIIYFSFKPATVSDFSDILLQVEAKDPNYLVVSIENKTNTKITYSEAFHIEKRSFWGWHRITLAPATFPAVACFLGAGEKSSPKNINYEVTYGVLAEGQYRLIKEFDIAGKTVTLAGYFDIT